MQKVTSLFQSERNIWVAKVDDFEVEMQISPSKVKACSCECNVFLNEKMCGHVAAGLLALRKKIAENLVIVYKAMGNDDQIKYWMKKS